MITERTLKKWRMDALRAKQEMNKKPDPNDPIWKDFMTILDRILRLTQDLQDIHLLRKVR